MIALLTLTEAPRDISTSGNYLIYNCGADADKIKSILDQTYISLQSAIESIGIPNVVYNAFFKGVDPSTVKTILQSITTGANRTVNGHGMRPTLICVTEDNPYIGVMWNRCLGKDVEAMYSINTPYIYLCPLFTKIRLYPPSIGCGRVTRAGTTLLTFEDMAFSQYTILVHELTHLYLKQDYLDPEVYEVNAALNLRSDQSIINPQNYAFYAAHIKAGCTQYPTTTTNTDRELLESDCHHTSDVIAVDPSQTVCKDDGFEATLGLCTVTA
ncbi:hypothetical protein MMC24_000460 [Lignoscripta atroalba]|nr:hypothetical protein [Lignoscripta atroalba]